MGEIQDRKLALFRDLEVSRSLAGLDPTGTSLICPLCWVETEFASLSIEHIIPQSVGGVSVTLTCRKCNNQSGSKLDWHLKGFQSTTEAMKGIGSIPVELRVDGLRMVADMEFKDGAKAIHFRVIDNEAAANPEHWRKLKARSVNEGDEIKATLHIGHTKNGFQTALLRSAYLAMFARYGYQFTMSETIQVIRRRIVQHQSDYPKVGTLVAQLSQAPIPIDADNYLIRAFMNGIPFMMVMIRLKLQTETWFAVSIPIPHERDSEFFPLAESHASENPTATFENIPPSAIVL